MDSIQKKYIIIGTSAAGLSAAHKIRQLDSVGIITCITEEEDLAYNKCLLADFLASSIEYPTFKTEKFFSDNRIDVITQCRIISINREEKWVQDSNRNRYYYDALLLATGGNLIRPENKTVSCKNVFDFYTYGQTQGFKQYMQCSDVQTILIIGAGLSGLECADALQNYKKSLVVVEKAGRVLALQITSEASEFLEKRIKSAHVNLLTNVTVTDFVIYEDRVSHVILSNGEKVLVDMVVYALGARANLELPQRSGLEVAPQGVIVNEFFQTNDFSIWAAGDICRVYNTLTQTHIKSCTWPDAMQQGMYAAHGMVGIVKPYKGAAPVISSHFFGVKFFTAGIIEKRDVDDIVLIEESNDHYIMSIMRHNIVQGFIIFGDNKSFFDLKHSLVTQSAYNKKLHTS